MGDIALGFGDGIRQSGIGNLYERSADFQKQYLDQANMATQMQLNREIHTLTAANAKQEFKLREQEYAQRAVRATADDEFRKLDLEMRSAALKAQRESDAEARLDRESERTIRTVEVGLRKDEAAQRKLEAEQDAKRKDNTLALAADAQKHELARLDRLDARAVELDKRTAGREDLADARLLEDRARALFAQEEQLKAAKLQNEEAALRVAAAAQQLADAPEDRSWRRELEQAQIEAQRASAAYNAAQAATAKLQAEAALGDADDIALNRPAAVAMTKLTQHGLDMTLLDPKTRAARREQLLELAKQLYASDTSDAVLGATPAAKAEAIDMIAEKLTLMEQAFASRVWKETAAIYQPAGRGAAAAALKVSSADMEQAIQASAAEFIAEGRTPEDQAARIRAVERVLQTTYRPSSPKQTTVAPPTPPSGNPSVPGQAQVQVPVQPQVQPARAPVAQAMPVPPQLPFGETPSILGGRALYEPIVPSHQLNTVTPEMQLIQHIMQLNPQAMPELLQRYSGDINRVRLEQLLEQLLQPRNRR